MGVALPQRPTFTTLPPEDDVTEEWKSPLSQLIFNVVSKYLITFCIAFLEIEKQLPCFAKVRSKRSNFLNFWRPQVVMAIPKSNFHTAYLKTTSLAIIFQPIFLAWTPQTKKTYSLEVRSPSIKTQHFLAF